MAMLNDQRVNFHRGKDWENHCVIHEFKEGILSPARYGVMTAKKDQEMRLKRFKSNSPPVFDGWKWAWGLEIWQRSWDLNLVCYDVSFRDTKRLKMTMFEGVMILINDAIFGCALFSNKPTCCWEKCIFYMSSFWKPNYDHIFRIFGIQPDPAICIALWLQHFPYDNDHLKA